MAGLGKLIREARLKNENEEGTSKVISVVAAIEKQTSEDHKEFSLVEVQALVKNLHKAVNAPSISTTRDVLWKRFAELYEAMNRPMPRAGGVYSPSSLHGACERMLFYRMSKVKQSNPNAGNPDAKTQRIFDCGSFWHWYMQTKLYRSGHLEQAEVPIEDAKRKIKGHGDGILKFDAERFLFEIKTMNSYGFAALRAPLEKHINQASIYAKTLGLKRIIFLYINKDNQELKEYIVNVDDKSVESSYKVIDRVDKAVVNKVAPERICKDIFTSDAISCKFRTHCFSTKK